MVKFARGDARPGAMLRTLSLSVLWTATLTACEGRRQQGTQQGGQPVAPTVSEAPPSDRPTGAPSGDNQDDKANAGQQGQDDLTAATGLSAAEMEKGKIYVNGWDGLQDEVPATVNWTLENTDGTPPPQGGTTPPTTGTTPPTTGTTPPPNGGTTGGDVEFRIKKGTGNGPWNTPDTEVVARVGKRFTIVNDDDVVHQWHTNGTPCQHGNPIQPGQSETCTPSEPFSAGPLYDHGTEGKFYIRAE